MGSTSSAHDNNPTTLTASHTVSGSNRLLLVGVSIWNADRRDDYVSTVSYGGTSLTKVGHHLRDNDSRVEIWALVAPTVGTANIVVTFNQQIDDGAGFGAISFTGVNQSTPYGSMASSDGDSRNTSLTISSASGELVFVVLASENQDGLPTAGSGINNAWRYKWIGNNRLIGAGGTLSGASSVTATWRLDDSDDWAMAGISINPSSGGGGASSCVTFRDEFSSENYSRQDGSANWASNWLETGDNNNASNGDIEIAGGELQLEGDGSSPSIEREINLADFNQATLTFDYRTSGSWEGSDRQYVYVSNDGGNNWTLLQTFSNDQSASSFSRDISAYIAGNFRLRFVEGASRNNEVFHYDNVQVRACDTTPPTITSVTPNCPGLTQVVVTFSEDVDSTTATDISNYTLDGGITITGATLTSSNSVTLDTTALTDLTSYTLTVNNIQDTRGNTIVSGTTYNISVNCAATPSCVTFRDEFSTESYSENDGTANWSTNWIESGDNNNASNGDIEISGGELQLEGDGSSPSIQRGADLSAYDTATLTFDYRTSGNWEPNDRLYVYASNNGGSSWTLINTFANDQSSASYSSDVGSYISNNFRLRFVEGASRRSELFHLDNVQVEACVTSALHHIEINHDGTALTCNPETITIRTCGNADCSTLYTGDVSVTLTPTGWTGGDTQTISGGSANLQLQRTTASVYTLGVSSTSPAATNALVCNNTSAGSNSCDITYHDSGFIYSVPDLTACQTSASFTVQAVRKDDTTQLCVPGFQSRSASVNFWTSYTSPNSGSKQLRLTHNSTDYNLATSSPGTPVTMNFDATGSATATVYYEDAGQLALQAQYTGSASDAGLTMTGSDSFISQPGALYVYSDDANSDCSPASASCSLFRRTDQAFNLKVRAACNNAPNYTLTPNFRLNNVTLSPTNVAPAVNNGNLAITTINFDAAANGEVVINNQALNEVGVFTITATPPALGYFGYTIPSGTSVNIGRFIPDHFFSLNPTLKNRSDKVCTDNFTYMGEDFEINYSLEARNSSNNPTQNYTGTFAKLDPTTGSAAFNYGTTHSSTDYSSRLSTNHGAATTVFTNGIATVSATLQLARSASLDGPLNPLSIGIAPQDSDGTLMQSYDLSLDGGANTHTALITNADLRYGRYNMENAFGPQTHNLAMSSQAQYYDSTNFITNTDDNCTAMNSGLIAFDLWSDNLGVGDTNVLSVNEPIVINGDAALVLTAPNSINTSDDNNGSVRVTTTVPGHLQYDWDSDGTDENPNGIATFGIYRGDDRIIFWREVTP